MATEPVAEPVTFDRAVGNAVRLLYAAETETNLALMERLEGLVDSWLNVADLIQEREGA
ncbi:hypothetical protein [Streptomyces sp. NPDC057877]|uniref:hypothetical protein n=1 Tax=Streptomyces sp. NPDC057877 TaxID=3346269 RepID=UPI00368C181F